MEKYNMEPIVKIMGKAIDDLNEIKKKLTLPKTMFDFDEKTKQCFENLDYDSLSEIEEVLKAELKKRDNVWFKKTKGIFKSMDRETLIARKCVLLRELETAPNMVVYNSISRQVNLINEVLNEKN